MLAVPVVNLTNTFASGPELIATLQVHENLRKAERLHRVSTDLKERRRLRLLFGRQTPALQLEPCPVPDRAA